MLPNIAGYPLCKYLSAFKNTSTKEEFEELLFCYMKEYSETECAMLYQSMVGSSYTVEIDNCLNVFSVL